MKALVRQWQPNGDRRYIVNEKNCGNCFFLNLKGISSLAPCGTCKFNKDNEELCVPWLKDRWVTDSDAFWKDPEEKKMTESYEKDAMRHKPGEVIPVKNPSEIPWPYPESKENPLDVQVGGGHYKALEIQPVQYIHANKIPFIEGNIIKYITRWRDKGGKADLEKCKHFIDLLIELEFKDEPSNVR
jgi:hypothetical protein